MLLIANSVILKDHGWIYQNSYKTATRIKYNIKLKLFGLNNCQYSQLNHKPLAFFKWKSMIALCLEK
jgi:hypothetical protein